VKSLASALCIGTGGSVGREGPIVQIGSALASSLGQWIKVPENRLRILVACGAAGGISATFNAPITDDRVPVGLRLWAGAAPSAVVGDTGYSGRPNKTQPVPNEVFRPALAAVSPMIFALKPQGTAAPCHSRDT
jgi:hypothetical protein